MTMPQDHPYPLSTAFASASAVSFLSPLLHSSLHLSVRKPICLLPGRPVISRGHSNHAFRFRACAPVEISPVPDATQSSNLTAPLPPSVLGRGLTFSRRRIGLYELHREGVDPSVLLKRSGRFGQIYALVLVAFTTTFFILPITTGIRLPEAPLAILIASVMGAYAVDTLAFNAATTTALVAAFNDRLRVARHEAAHLLVAHLLGFCVEGYVLPFPKQMFAAARGVGAPPGVALARGLAEGDMRLVAAVGLAGLAGELLSYDTCKGADNDMGEVSRRVRSAIRERRASSGEDTGDFLAFVDEDEEVLHVVRWGLLVATRLVKVHSEAFEAVVEAMLSGESVDGCLALVDSLAVADGLVEQPFGTL